MHMEFRVRYRDEGCFQCAVRGCVVYNGFVGLIRALQGL